MFTLQTDKQTDKLRPDSPRDFGAIQIIYLLTYLLKQTDSKILPTPTDRVKKVKGNGKRRFV